MGGGSAMAKMGPFQKKAPGGSVRDDTKRTPGMVGYPLKNRIEWVLDKIAGPGP